MAQRLYVVTPYPNIPAPDIVVQEIPLAHSFNEGQIAWFKAGSALNLVSFCPLRYLWNMLI